MPAIGHNTPESALLQAEIHKELIRRGTVEADDQTMAEYVTVLCINEKPIEEIGQELVDIGGADFDASFLSWLTDRVDAVKSGVQSFSAEAAVTAALAPVAAQAAAPASSRGAGSSSRLLSSALAPLAQDQSRHAPPTGYKRGPSPGADGPYKRRSVGNGHLPSGPKAMRGDDDDIMMDDDQEDNGRDGRRSNGNRGSLLDRISGPPRSGGLTNGAVVDSSRFDRPMRNMRGRGMRPMGGMMNRGFGPGMGGVNPMEMQMQAQMMAMMQNGGMGFGGQGMMDPMAVMMQQQEQLVHMQIMMNQMAEAVNKGGPVHQAPVRPPKPTAQPAQKLGDHTIIARPGVKAPPAAAKAHEPVPTKPTSPDLCKFGVGCTNVRCPYSHPSPVATIASGVVLRTDPCPNGKACKDADCSYSHVSPAQVHGETAGEKRVLCKFPVCTNPACQFRHEDANGNAIPPPALTRSLNKEASREVDMDADHDDWDVQVGETTAASGLSTTPARSESDIKASLDQPLGDSNGKKQAVSHPLNGTIRTPCRFGLACTNKMCKFTHPIDTPCRFGTSCFKEDCPFSHPPGRKTKSMFKNNATKNKSTSFNPSAPSFTPKPHISERKFVDESQEVTKLEQDGAGSAIDVVAETTADEAAAAADL